MSLTAINVTASRRHAIIDQIADKVRKTGFPLQAGLTMSRFLLVVEQAGRVHQKYLDATPGISYHPAVPIISGLYTLQLALNSCEGVLAQVSDDDMLTLHGQVDSLFFNTWVQFFQNTSHCEAIKKIAADMGVIFGQV